jgi:hypothetical protein
MKPTPKTKHKRKDAVANESFKTNMRKIKRPNITWFYRHKPKHSYPYPCSLRGLAHFLDRNRTPGARQRGPGRRPGPFVLSVCDFGAPGIRQTPSDPSTFHPTHKNCVFARFEARPTHARVQKRALNDAAKRAARSTSAPLPHLFFITSKGTLTNTRRRRGGPRKKGTPPKPQQDLPKPRPRETRTLPPRRPQPRPPAATALTPGGHSFDPRWSQL